MIKYLTCFCCLLLSSKAFSQVDANYNYSIGLKVYSLTQMPKTMDEVNSQKLTHSIGNGVFVKFNDNQISLRIGVTYYYNGKAKFANLCESCEEAKGNQTDYSFKVGFEKSLNYAAVQPYFGLDLGYRSNNFSGQINSIAAGSTKAPYSFERTKTGLIMSPLLGIKFNFIDNLTFYAESSLDFFWSYERRETTSLAPGNPSTFNKYNRLEYLLSPLSTGLQFHFGSKN